VLVIPEYIVVLFGIIACAREAYNIFCSRQLRNAGSLFAFAYLTAVYSLLATHSVTSIEFHGSPFVRVGILLIFLDKAIAFIFEALQRRRKWIT